MFELKQQRLVLAILEFLNKSINDGTFKADDKESLEVAVQCIGEAFGVDPSDEQQVEKLSIKPMTLQQVFDLYMKTRDKVEAQAHASASTSQTSTSRKQPSAEEKSKAEIFKQDGNSNMSVKKYEEAIKAYTEAISLDGTNPVYYSNRAAAHSSKGDHHSAIDDAEQAISIDPSFSKGYHRLGHAYYSLSDYKAAAEAFERGLKIDANNIGLKSGLANAKARIPQEDDAMSRERPSSSDAGMGPGSMGGMADMLRNLGGGGGGGGGMPDLASMMNNPQIMQMAQQMTANGGLSQLMQNPALANMMNRVQSGGGMPSMDELMGDPQLRELAAQFGAGMGGGAGLGGGAGRP